jgi:hypothetical protein
MANGLNPNDFDWPPVDLKPEDPTPEFVLESEVHHWEQGNVHVRSYHEPVIAEESGVPKAT